MGRTTSRHCRWLAILFLLVTSGRVLADDARSRSDETVGWLAAADRHLDTGDLSEAQVDMTRADTSFAGVAAPAPSLEAEVIQRRARLAAALGDTSAMGMAARVVVLRRRAAVPDTLALVWALIHEARIAIKFTNTARGETGLEEAGRLIALLPTRPSLAVGALEHETGMLLSNRNRAREAEPHFEAAHAIRLAELGEDHPDTAMSRLMLGIIKLRTGRVVEAKPDYEAALGSLLKSTGPGSLEYLWALNSYGTYLQWCTDFAGARQAYERVLKTRHERHFPADLTQAWTLHNLGVIAQEQSSFAEAETLYSQAYDIRRRYLGDHPFTARSLAASGSLLFLRGDYAAARAPLEEALAMFEGAGQGAELDAGICLMNLGTLQYWLAENEAAMARYERALPIIRRNGRPRDRLACLQRLGECDAAGQRWSAAEARYHEALGIADAPPQLAGGVRVDLALVLARGHRFAEADSEFTAAIRLLEEFRETSATDLMFALSDYGHVLVDEGLMARGEAVLTRAVTMLDSVLDAAHPDCIRSLIDLSRAQQSLGNADAAWASALRAANLELPHLLRNADFMTERHALSYFDSREGASSRLVALLAALPHPTNRQISEAWEVVVNRRNLVLDEVLLRNQASRAGGRARRAREALTRAQQRLANLHMRGTADVDAAQYGRLLAEAEADREACERAWAIATRTKKSRLRERVSLSRVLEKLPPSATLVSYVRYDTGVRRSEGPRCSGYACFVGSRDRHPSFVDLGGATAIDQALESYRRHCDAAPARLQDDPTATELEYESLGGRLRALVWDPVAGLSAGSPEVVIVADGSLMNVSFAALPTAGRRFLIDDGPVFKSVAAERDLLRPRGRASRGLLAMGDPAFGRSRAAYRFANLPASQRELAEVSRIWTETHSPTDPAESFTGARATEEAFLRTAPGKSVLHLATHAIVPDIKESDEPAGETELIQRGLASGLAFADGTVAPTGTASASDGFLSAEEISRIDLDGVALAVLSACRSGLSRTQAGESVGGLRRAFQVAGVRCLLSSVWPVDDESTFRWMSRFYNELWRAHSPPAAATRAVSRKILEELRSESECVHPFYWGSFMSVGAID